MGAQANIKTVKICTTYATTSLTTTRMLNDCFLQQAMENSYATDYEVKWNDLFLMLAFIVLIILKLSIVDWHDMFQYCKKTFKVLRYHNA